MDGHVRNVLIGRIPLCYPVKKGHFFGNNMLFIDMFSQEDEIRKAVAEQVHIYAKSTLRKLYRGFFQDHLGLGHIVSDTASAGAYLREELATVKRFDGSCLRGYDGNFYRVNLSLVKDCVILYAVNFDVFVRSVNSVCPMPVEEWKKEWALINSVISDMDLHGQTKGTTAGKPTCQWFAPGNHWFDSRNSYVSVNSELWNGIIHD